MHTETLTIKKIKVTIYFNGRYHAYEAQQWEDGDKTGIEDLCLTYRPESPLFLYVEDYFDQWVKHIPRDWSNMYFQECEEFDGGTYLSKKGAIIQAIDVIADYIQENNLTFLNLPKVIYTLDIEGGAFQP